MSTILSSCGATVPFQTNGTVVVVGAGAHGQALASHAAKHERGGVVLVPVAKDLPGLGQARSAIEKHHAAAASAAAPSKTAAIHIGGKLLGCDKLSLVDALKQHFVSHEADKHITQLMRKKLGFRVTDTAEIAPLHHQLAQPDASLLDAATQPVAPSKHHVKHIDPLAQLVTLSNGSQIAFDKLICSIPTPELASVVATTDPAVAAAVKTLASLDHVTTHIITVALDGPMPPHLVNHHTLHFLDTSALFHAVRIHGAAPGSSRWSLDIELTDTFNKDRDTIIEESLLFAEMHSLYDTDLCTVIKASVTHTAQLALIRTRNMAAALQAIDTLAAHHIHLSGVFATSNLDHDVITQTLVQAQATVTSLLSLASAASQPAAAESDVCAVFMHSLQRNGANNCALFTVSATRTSRKFLVVSPSDGPMRADFEELGVEITIVDPKSATYKQDLLAILEAPNVKLVLANTIMRADVVVEAEDRGVPTAWVIHEAWPPAQFEYYAKEVFMMSHIDSQLIRNAFAKCNRLVFPSNVQRDIYRELLDRAPATGQCSEEDELTQDTTTTTTTTTSTTTTSEAAIDHVETIYNGIPLEHLDSHMAPEVRATAREQLGYSDDDFVILHIGTICQRKGQIITAQAFIQLCDQLAAAHPSKSVKLLMIGARYIRDHEIKYIESIKQAVNASSHADRVTIMDIQRNPCPFYAAADLVLVPSLNEVLPLVICEAMAMRKPVICSSIDAIPEAVTHGVEGLLVEAGSVDGLCQAMWQVVCGMTDADRAAMGAKGRERVLRQFSFDACQAKYHAMFEQMLL